MPSDPEPDTLGAEQLLLDTDESRRGWRRRAVRMPKDQALAQIPRSVVMQTLAPIEAARLIKAHIALRRTNEARWMRQAIADRYLLEGGDPAVAQALMTVREDRRRRDVPRDNYGQPRNRVGRKTR